MCVCGRDDVPGGVRRSSWGVFSRGSSDLTDGVFFNFIPRTQGVASLVGSDEAPATNRAAEKEEAQIAMMRQMQQQMQAMQQQQQQQGGMGEEEELSALERFCTDVTDEARRGLLDPLVGREEEV